MCSRSEDDDALRVSCCSGIGAGAAGRKWMDSAGDEGMSHTRSGSRSSAVFSASVSSIRSPALDASVRYFSAANAAALCS